MITYAKYWQWIWIFFVKSLVCAIYGEAMDVKNIPIPTQQDANSE